MKKQLSVFICGLLLLGFYSCNNHKYTITANIKGLGNDTVYVRYYALNSEIKSDAEMLQDTIVAHNDKFQYNLPVHENMAMMIHPKKLLYIRADGSSYWYNTRYMELVLEPGKPISITGQIEGTDYITYKVKQSSFTSDDASDRKYYKTPAMKVDSIEMEIDYYCFSAKVDDMPTEKRDSIIYALFKERDKWNGIIREHKLSYLKNHLDKDLAAYYLIQQPIEVFGIYCPQLAESVKKGIFEKFLNENQRVVEKYSLYQQAKEHIVEGAEAPDFCLQNLAGESLSLSSLKGKYIVLDFWGSWCGPCLMGMPEMKKYYDKYKNKVEFVGIACSDKEAAWRKAVEENGLSWIQLKDNEDDFAKNISVRYAVGAYPTKFILDKNLKIIAIFHGEGEDFYQKLDVLLK